MTDFPRDLVDLLTVRKKEPEFYIGDVESYVPQRLYGGHLVAQGLCAAFETVDEDKLAHSIHANYHKMGDTALPVEYQVEILKNGRSFSSRMIFARQNGDLVFSMTISFKKRDLDEFFQSMTPTAPPAEVAIETFVSLGGTVDGATRGGASAGGRILVYPLTNIFKPEEMFDIDEERSRIFQSWMRLPSERSLTDRQKQMLLVFISDGPLPGCSAAVFGDPHTTHQTMSLDHSIWLHQLGDLRDWVLFEASSIVTADGRGLNDGNLYSRDGKLLASIRQESLLRRLKNAV
ncbi:MAG: thioesterase family protein [Pseudomonadales bacterium]|nr:thioesterase family protein [Pseudomonadales bacterium]